MPLFRPYTPGQTRLSAAQLNAAAADLTALVKIDMPGATVGREGGVVNLNLPILLEAFWARIDGEGTDDKAGTYAWTEMELLDNGKFRELEGGRKGTVDSDPLEELNRSSGVPLHTIVRVWPGTPGPGPTPETITNHWKFLAAPGSLVELIRIDGTPNGAGFQAASILRWSPTSEDFEAVADCLFLEPNGATVPGGYRILGLFIGTTDDDAALPVYVGDYQDGSGSDSCQGCGWVAGLRGAADCPEFPGDCLLLTVLSAAGHCRCIDTGQSVLLEFSGGVWVGTFATCVGDTPVTFDPNGCSGPCLTLGGGGGSSSGGGGSYPLTLDCCGDDWAIFSGPGLASGNAVCNGAWATAPPHDNTFRVKVSWQSCQNPDWSGPGWYCVGVEDTAGGCDVLALKDCVYVAADPGPCYRLCGGPYATREACQAVCNEIPKVDVCGDGSVMVPAAIYFMVTSVQEGSWGVGTAIVGVPIALSYDGGGSWTATVTFDCGTFAIFFSFGCDPLTGTYSWQINMEGSNTLDYANGSSSSPPPSPFFLHGTGYWPGSYTPCRTGHYFDWVISETPP